MLFVFYNMGMNENKPLITVAVPVWNGEPYIKTCLDSIKNQTYTNIEVIVADNHSTDNSYELIKKYVDEDKRFSVVTSDVRKCAAQSRNEAVAACHGKYILFVDVDDYIGLDTIEKLYNAISDGDKDLAYCDWYKFYPNGQKEERRLDRPEYTNDVLDREGILSLQKRIVGDSAPTNPMNLDLFSSLAGKLYKVDLIRNNKLEIMHVDKIGGADDALFNVDYLQFASSGVHIHDCLYYYFSNPKSYSHVQKVEKIDMFPLQYEQFRLRMAKYEKDESYNVSLAYRIYIQSFGAFIIATTSGISKKEQKEVLRKYLDNQYFKDILPLVSYKTFGWLFKPFFKGIKKGRLGFCLKYIRLATWYRGRKAK